MRRHSQLAAEVAALAADGFGSACATPYCRERPHSEAKCRSTFGARRRRMWFPVCS